MSDPTSSTIPASPESNARIRTRSPNYPSMSLPEALTSIEKLWNAQHKHPAHVDSVLKLLGFSSMTGPAGRAIGALAQYGLTKEQGSGENRTIALSDLALDYILADNDQAKASVVHRAALKPTVFAQLWEKYGQFLPNDDTIQKYLVREKNFNPGMVASVVSDFRATFDFAELGFIVPVEIKTPQTDPPNPSIPKVSEPLTSSNAENVSKPPPVVPQQRSQSPMNAGLRYLPIPLDIGDAPIPVGMSEEDYDLLLDTLKLWKKKIVRVEVPPTREVAMDFVARHAVPYRPDTFPKQAIWRNKDNDMPVTITGIAGKKDGITFFQTSTGTGIPESELEFQEE